MPETLIPPGRVVCTTHGIAQTETAFWLMEMRSHAEKEGLVNVEWMHMGAGLVDKSRNDALRSMLGSQAQWTLFIDLDMLGEKDAVLKMLQTAYGSHPQFDVLGGYCTLKGENCLPSMDTGTGTWETIFPGQGVVEVMRTGAAFLLVKRHVAERVPEPWFALRVPQRPLDAVAEVDCFTRTIFDGKNPFAGEKWDTMVRCAANHHTVRNFVATELGEDSSFCDRVTNAGLRIAVDTNLVIAHITKQAKGWQDHRDAMAKQKTNDRLMSGLLE